jgi:hypothetical protein
MKRISILIALSVSTLALGQIRADRAAFDRLVKAHDKDILVVVKDNALVCFADEPSQIGTPDRFLVIHLATFDNDAWFAAEEGANAFGDQDILVKQSASSIIDIWEHEDISKSVIFGYAAHSEFTQFGHYVWLHDKSGKKRWTSSGTTTFQGASENGFNYIKQSVLQDETNYIADQTYTNGNNGTTEWSISVRLSTGRYVETWDVTDKGQTESHPLDKIVGRCSPAKTLVSTNSR